MLDSLRKPPHPLRRMVLIVWLICCTNTVAAETRDTAAMLSEASVHFEQGAFNKAIASWRSVVSAPGSGNDAKVRAYFGIAAACQRIGLYQEARSALVSAEPLLSSQKDPEMSAQFHLQSGNLHFAAHRYADALESLSAASAQAALVERRELRALILNDYANALLASGYATDAIAAYTQARELAAASGLTAVVLATSVNLTRIFVQQGDSTNAITAIETAQGQWNISRPSFEWAMAGLALVELRRQSGDASPQVDLEMLAKIDSYAESMQNTRLRAAANLSRGITQGEASLRKAIFFASQAQAPDILYEAYWRLAQTLRRQDRLDESIAAFELALAALNPIRDELMNGPRDSQRFFQGRIRPVYTDFVDALMSSSNAADASKQPGSRQPGPQQPGPQQSRLERARNAIEALRGAELQDYFRDECVTNRSRSTLVRPMSGVAILYPIVLAERVELLLLIDGELHRQSVDVTQDQINEAALRLREFAQDGSHERFKPHAMRLYRWLIDPVRADLQKANVETLVVVPDGALRTVPFAVLHDGERYLIEDFALAVTPALKLTAAAPPLKSGRVLLAGVAQPVQGFAPLPEVATELQSIRNSFGGRVLSDRDYTKANLKAALAGGDYNIVHMATHSTLSAASADSFLLTYDGQLSLTDLESALRSDEREPRIDLLTLSACETAVGDERAALGLAGMAVKSGAASVLASIWKVDDAATAMLMASFYEQLQKGGVAKARALRSAQLSMLADPQYAHPSNWAAFMLIGNWQ